MRKIGGILGRSPFGPMHEHFLKVAECLGLVGGLAEAACRGDAAAVKATAGKLSRTESEADALKKAIRIHLTTSVFASVSRSEILALVKAQDDVADQCERLGYELSIRRTKFPAFLAKHVNDLAAKLASAGEPLSAISRMLDQTAGHLGKDEGRQVASLLEKTRKIVTRTEALRDRFLRRLFAREDEVEVLDAVFLMHFADRCDKAAGKIENVADVITRLIAEAK